MNAQTFVCYSILIWYYGAYQIEFSHAPLSLLVINLCNVHLSDGVAYNNFVHATAFLAEKTNSNNIAPTNASRLFSNLFKVDLH